VARSRSSSEMLPAFVGKMEREGTRELESHCKQSSADEGHSDDVVADLAMKRSRAAVGLCEQGDPILAI
jgi:hypothetical protein